MHDFQQDVDRLILWCQKNRLSINVKKTKPVFYPFSGDGEILQKVTIQNTPLNYVSSYLYLGVDIDNQLLFKTFYNNTLKKISYKLSLLRRIRYMLTEKAALDIVKTCLYKALPHNAMKWAIFLRFLASRSIPEHPRTSQVSHQNLQQSCQPATHDGTF